MSPSVILAAVCTSIGVNLLIAGAHYYASHREQRRNEAAGWRALGPARRPPTKPPSIRAVQEASLHRQTKAAAKVRAATKNRGKR